MKTIQGTYRKGKVVLDEPVDWPEETPVVVRCESNEVELTEANWPETPEARAALARRIETLEPLEFTAEEEADLAAWRAEIKRVTIEAVREQMGLKP